MRVDIHVETSSQAFRETLKKYGYVLECEVHGQIRTIEGFGEVNGTYHKVMLHVINTALLRMRQPSEIHIHTRDEYISNMHRTELNTWIRNDFRKANGTKVSNEAEWRLFTELTKVHPHIEFISTSEYFTWLRNEMQNRSC